MCWKSKYYNVNIIHIGRWAYIIIDVYISHKNLYKKLYVHFNEVFLLNGFSFWDKYNIYNYIYGVSLYTRTGITESITIVF